MNTPQDYYIQNHNRYTILYTFSYFTMFIALWFDSPWGILQGLYKIIISPSQLFTDYMAVGGVGAAFFNAGFLMLLALFSLQRRNHMLTGPLVAGLFTLFGFSFFGKNMFNTIPITFGVYLYAKLENVDYDTLAMHTLFGTALGPVVSYICFGMNLVLWKGLLFSYLTGTLIGLIIPPLSSSFLKFHKGFTLYNIGFTCGMIGLFLKGILRVFHLDVQPASIFYTENNIDIVIFLYLFFLIAIFGGFAVNKKSFYNLKKLLSSSGKSPTNFAHLCGHGITLMNMGALGIMATSLVLLTGQVINGPVLGAIFTVFGFGIFGKHIKNTFPIFVGAILAFEFLPETHSPVVLATVLFATNLAPIAGEYGLLAGIASGFLHVLIVQSVGLLHGGLNLYNNGFSGGFVAATALPILESIRYSSFARMLRGNNHD